MTTGRWMGVLTGFLIVYMVATVALAVFQGSMPWRWWWTVPVGGGFIVIAMAFRILVQRSVEAAERADREADAAESTSH